MRKILKNQMKIVNKTKAIRELLSLSFENINSQEKLANLKRQIIKKYQLDNILNSEILEKYLHLLKNKKIELNDKLKNVLIKREIRTLSGIAPVAILTKPYKCPGTCAYCPREKNVPVSYLSSEPAVMRAIRCDYSPYKQSILRLKALEQNGHHPSKIEIIVIGGTFSYLPEKYQYWYILNTFKAVNDYQRLKSKISLDFLSEKKSIFNIKLKDPYSYKFSLREIKELLIVEQKKNERAKYQIIGLTLETRPDYINDKELKKFRELGSTRVEIGVQAINDQVLEKNKRGHDISAISLATKLLKNYGFKVTYHFMPNLPGSSTELDFQMFKELFNDARWQPDQIKFYPTVVVKGSLLYTWYKQGKYQAYSDEELQDLIIKCKAVVPPYVRIIRLIRDIPSQSIVAGNKITNLRQIMKQRGVKCNCIRCREVGNLKKDKIRFNIIKYQASKGMEYFLNYESADKKYLYAFCRLRITKNSKIAPALIRELHVYGKLVPIGGEKKIQHSGLGKKLIKKAEQIAKRNKVNKLAIISGVGVRNYYRKLGYRLEKSYLIKKI